jgi:hypothetical protein
VAEIRLRELLGPLYIEKDRRNCEVIRVHAFLGAPLIFHLSSPAQLGGRAGAWLRGLPERRAYIDWRRPRAPTRRMDPMLQGAVVRLNYLDRMDIPTHPSIYYKKSEIATI